MDLKTIYKKAQGIALNTIVLAAIAIMVLILIIGFTTGGLGNIFKGFQRSTASTDLQTAISTCNSYCNLLQTQAFIDENTIKNSEWCTKTFWIDENRNGKVDPNEEKHCYDITSCTVTVGEKPKSIDEGMCK